ncbi:hypothetical protein EF808_00040 [archaeon]|nr:MAG: hypothetical protein EF808_00040 [archaeon]
MAEQIPKELSENLYSNENVLFCIKKRMKTELKPKFLGVTDRRIIYLDQKVLGRYNIEDIPYEKLKLVHFKSGKLAAEFTLTHEDGHDIRMSWMNKDEVKEAIEAVRDALNNIAVEQVTIKKKKGLMSEEWQISKPKEMVSRVAPVRPSHTEPEKRSNDADPYEQLKKLKELLDADIISQEEYSAKRDALLSKI